jgi:hypothetical protein
MSSRWRTSGPRPAGSTARVIDRTVRFPWKEWDPRRRTAPLAVGGARHLSLRRAPGAQACTSARLNARVKTHGGPGFRLRDTAGHDASAFDAPAAILGGEAVLGVADPAKRR